VFIYQRNWAKYKILSRLLGQISAMSERYLNNKIIPVGRLATILTLIFNNSQASKQASKQAIDPNEHLIKYRVPVILLKLAGHQK